MLVHDVLLMWYLGMWHFFLDLACCVCFCQSMLLEVVQLHSWGIFSRQIQGGRRDIRNWEGV